MTLEEIKEKIDWLMDDNHVCLGIEHAEESSEEDISEARMRRRANLLEMQQLTKEWTKLMEEEREKANADSKSEA